MVFSLVVVVAVIVVGGYFFYQHGHLRQETITVTQSTKNCPSSDLSQCVFVVTDSNNVIFEDRVTPRLLAGIPANLAGSVLNQHQLLSGHSYRVEVVGFSLDLPFIHWRPQITHIDGEVTTRATSGSGPF
jgi:hypothetical protein